MTEATSCENMASTRDVVARDGVPGVPFHRHCQKTVCSAHGYMEAIGKTWDLIDILSLPNIQKVLGSVSWKGYFTKNNDNITQDLASILELIDKVAGKSFQFNVKFIDANNHEIRAASSGTAIQEVFKPGVESDINHIFKVGRMVELKFKFTDDATVEDEYIAKFNTMQTDVNDKCQVKIPAKTLTISFNESPVGTAFNVAMPEDVDIDIIDDYNEIPSTSYSGSLTLRKYKHVYKIANAPAALYGMNLNAYSVSPVNADTSIIGFEVHIQNTGGTRLNLNNPSVSSPAGNTVYALTDQLYVEAGRTNVYVFRWDRLRKKVTYSLAYQYA